jgi:hypothetical protein
VAQRAAAVFTGPHAFLSTAVQHVCDTFLQQLKETHVLNSIKSLRTSLLPVDRARELAAFPAAPCVRTQNPENIANQRDEHMWLTFQQRCA